MWRTIAQGNVWRGIVKNKKKDGNFYWVHATITPVLGANGKPERYIGVRVDITAEREKDQLLAESSQNIQQLNESLALAKDQLEKKLQARNLEIHDSVVYAQRLQRAVMPTPRSLEKHLPPNYEVDVLFRPRDVVSGDFYWLGRAEDKCVLVTGDGTGHGVPGAFMTLLGMTNLAKLVEERHVTEPAQLLTRLDAEVKRTLHQTAEGQQEMLIQDSLEMTALTFTDGHEDLQVASAMRPVLIVRADGSLMEFLPSKKTVGGTQFLGDEHFEADSFRLQPGDTCYLFSDGYQTQLGGPGKADKKFGKKEFYELLSQLATVNRLSDRAKVLYKKLDEWKGFFQEPTDDVLVLMLRRKS
jgi:serine phosphatase RsbU (regulator of sigma subunit)